MTKRRAVLNSSAVLLLALATGCSSSPAANTPVTAVGGVGGAGLISNNASGLISNNAGGLISNNAGGLISNNAGGLISNNAGGLISNNAGGLISNNAGGLISNNAGGLTGSVRGPAAGLISNNAGGLISNNAGGLISNNAGGLISNNAGGLISNNAGGLISNNAGGYHLMADDASGADLTEPVKGAKVAVFNERDEQISYAWTTTDDNGNYTFDRLKPSGATVFVKAVYEREGKQVTLVSTAPAPRKSGLLTANVTPSSTIVAKKLGEMIRLRSVNVASVHSSSLDKIAAELAPVMTPKAVVAAAILPAANVAASFDSMLVESPTLAAVVKATGNSEGIASAVAVTPPENVTNTGNGNNAPAPVAADPTPAPTQTNAPADPGNPNNPTGTGPVVDGGNPANPSSGGTTPPAGGTTVTSTLTDTIFTLGTVSSVANVDMATGSNSFIAAMGVAVSGGAVSLGSQLTFNEDGSNLAKAVSFDGNTPYYLVDNTIVGNGKTVTMGDIDPSDTFDLAVKNGVAYVSMASKNYILKVDLASGTDSLFAGVPGDGNFSDGAATDAHFNTPKGLCFSGNTLYVADTYNHRLRAIAADGTVTTLAGQIQGSADGVGQGASFGSLTDVTADNKGNLFVADQTNQVVRKIEISSGIVTTVAGNHIGNTTDGTADKASLFYPTSLCWGKAGGTDVLVVSQSNHKIRLVSGY